MEQMRQCDHSALRVVGSTREPTYRPYAPQWVSDFDCNKMMIDITLDQYGLTHYGVSMSSPRYMFQAFKSYRPTSKMRTQLCHICVLSMCFYHK